jgi:predicted alpha/beta hydrolase family esterase
MHCLIIPGLRGSGEHHWQTHWQNHLALAERVEQRDWASPDLETWLATLAEHVMRCPGATLIGHSLGAVLIAHFAVRYPGLNIGRSLLVAPADPERPWERRLASFAPLPKRPLGFPSILVASRTDPFMAQDKARDLADQWHADFVDAGDARRINVARGHGLWKGGLALLNRLGHRRGTAGPPSSHRVDAWSVVDREPLTWVDAK